MGKYLQKQFEIAPDQIGVSLEVSQRIGQLKDDRRFFVELAEAVSWRAAEQHCQANTRTSGFGFGRVSK